MRTIDAAEHSLMHRMHEAGLKGPPERQHMRSVIALEATDFDQRSQGDGQILSGRLVVTHGGVRAVF